MIFPQMNGDRWDDGELFAALEPDQREVNQSSHVLLALY
jgi:hypothetical protein